MDPQYSIVMRETYGSALMLATGCAPFVVSIGALTTLGRDRTSSSVFDLCCRVVAYGSFRQIRWSFLSARFNEKAKIQSLDLCFS